MSARPIALPAPAAPPHDLDVEQALLGSILISPDAFYEAFDVVTERDFYSDPHQRIYGTIASLYGEDQTADMVTVAARLRTTDELARVGGAAYLSDLCDRGLGASIARQYATVVREKAMLRELMAVCGDGLTQARAQKESPREIVEAVERGIFRVAERGTQRPIVDVARTLFEWMRELEARQENGVGANSVLSGFRDLDNATGGLRRGEVILVGGRTSMGKSAFALSIAENVALDQGRGVAIFSLEMSRAEVMDRLIAGVARVNLQRIRTGRVDKQDLDRITAATARLVNTVIRIDDSPTLTPLDIRAACRRLKREPGVNLGLVIVDYLQLVTAAGRHDSREQEIAEISRAMKALAKEIDVPVLGLAQLNRQVENRSSATPRLSDLRESGAQEQDADIVLFLYRPEYYQPGQRPGEADVIVAKQRNGPTPTIPVAFLGEFTRFEDLARNYSS